jgi:hypothetical protein
MSSCPAKTLLTICVYLICLLLSTPSRAFLSDDVYRAMDEANACGQAHQNYIYSECMQINYEKLKKNILNKSQQQLQNYGTSKKQKLLQNINNKIKSNHKLCTNEKARLDDSMNGERRYPYCLYENMLEVLINVERNIEIYAH